MRKLGIETLFFGVVLPLCVAFTVVGAVLGVLLLPVDALRRGSSNRWDTWKSLGSVWRVVGKHLRYLWRAEAGPRLQRWRDGQAESRRDRRSAKEEAAAERVSRQERLAELRARRRFEAASSRVGRTRSDLSRLDEADAVLALYLLANLLPFVAVLPHLVLVAVATAVSLGSWHYYGVAEPRLEPRPPVVIIYEPQVEDRQEADYGPWLDLGDLSPGQAGDPGFLNLALLSDTGTVRYSALFRGDGRGFRDCPFTERIVVSRLNAAGRVEFEDSRHNRFIMNPGQVFLLEGYRSRAFRFGSDGTLQSVRLEDLQTVPIVFIGSAGTDDAAVGESN